MTKSTAKLSYKELLQEGNKRLLETSDTPKIDAEVLLLDTLNQPLAWLIAHGEEVAPSSIADAYLSSIAEREKGLPIAYILGNKEFWSLSLKVNEHVLVPRADTETLVESALELLSDLHNCAILDLGTGSGAIALALAKERSDCSVIAVDASPEALEVARQNAAANQLSNVRFLLSNWYSNLRDQKFDLIAANPPYVAEGDPHLDQGDLRFEPNQALVSGANGYADLTTIIEQASEYLKPKGKLIVEHGFQQGEGVHDLFEQSGFGAIKLYKDLNNLPRCTSGVLNG